MTNTKSFISKMVAAAAGWNQDTFSDHDPKNGMAYVYLWDQPTDYLMLTAIELPAFKEAIEKARAMPSQELAVAREALSFAIARLGITRDASQSLDLSDSASPSIMQVVALSVVPYATCTSYFKDNTLLTAPVHFVVMRYGMAGSRSSVLRSFCSTDPKPMPLDVTFLRDTVNSVHNRDRALHPDWFI